MSCRACALVFQRFELSFELLFAMASSLIYLVCFSFTVALMIEEVRSSGVFELRFDRFQNELGRDAKGHCCDGFKASSSSSSNGGRCSEACRTQFRVCLKHYQTSIDLSGTCTYGDFSTPVLGDNSLDFNSSTTTNGYTVRLPFEFSWPVSNFICRHYVTCTNERQNLGSGHLLAHHRSLSPAGQQQQHYR